MEEANEDEEGRERGREENRMNKIKKKKKKNSKEGGERRSERRRWGEREQFSVQGRFRILHLQWYALRLHAGNACQV